MNNALGNLGKCPQGFVGCDSSTITPEPTPVEPVPVNHVSTVINLGGALGHNPVIIDNDDNKCIPPPGMVDCDLTTSIIDNDDIKCIPPPGMVDCDPTTSSPPEYKQCEVGVMGCDPNANGLLGEYVPVCHYLPAEDCSSNEDSIDSWVPKIINLDYSNMFKVIHAINRETVIIRIAPEDYI